jgi:hypothetical protein
MAVFADAFNRHNKLGKQSLPMTTFPWATGGISKREKKRQITTTMSLLQKQVETSTHFVRCSANPGFLLSLCALDREIQRGDAHPVKYLIAEAARRWSQSDNLYASELSP